MRSLTGLIMWCLAALTLAGCGGTSTSVEGPGIHWIGPEEGVPGALLTGTLEVVGDCLQIVGAETGETYGLVLASAVDASEDIVDGSLVTAGGGEMPAENVEGSSDVVVPSPGCLIGRYWYTVSLEVTG